MQLTYWKNYEDYKNMCRALEEAEYWARQKMRIEKQRIEELKKRKKIWNYN